MPIYGFECPACGHQFDRLQKLADPDPTACPSCAKEGVRRQLTAPAFRLAGSGWYETDFKKDGDKKRNLAGSDGSSGSSEGGSDKTSETKSESKSEAKPAASPTASADAKPAAKPASSPKPASKE